MTGPVIKRRFSIWGREYGADHDVELCQVDSDPLAMVDALAQKMLKVQPSAMRPGKKSKIRKYTYLRIVENAPTR